MTIPLGCRENLLIDFRKEQISLDVSRRYCIIHIQYDRLFMITPSLQQERSQILEEMARIDHMIRGHVSEQTFRVQRAGQTVTQGPYFLLQRRENGRNNCQRVGTDEVPTIVAGVQAYARFQKLAQRYATLTEQMTWDQQSPDIKKKFRPFWRPASRKPRSV